MATKKKQTKTVATAMVKNHRADSLTAGFLSIDKGFRALAEVLSAPLAPAQLALTFRKLKVWEKDVEALYEVGRKAIIELLKHEGIQDSDSERRTLTAGELVLSMRPWRTGYDSKKVEKLIRSKGGEPSRFMDSKVTFAVNEEKLGEFRMKYGVTDDELESAKYDESWTVENPSTLEAE